MSKARPIIRFLRRLWVRLRCSPSHEWVWTLNDSGDRGEVRRCTCRRCGRYLQLVTYPTMPHWWECSGYVETPDE